MRGGESSTRSGTRRFNNIPLDRFFLACPEFSLECRRNTLQSPRRCSENNVRDPRRAERRLLVRCARRERLSPLLSKIPPAVDENSFPPIDEFPSSAPLDDMLPLDVRESRLFPAYLMASWSSLVRMSRTVSTPSWPKAARPRRHGRPTQMAAAPRGQGDQDVGATPEAAVDEDGNTSRCSFQNFGEALDRRPSRLLGAPAMIRTDDRVRAVRSRRAPRPRA